MTMKGNRFANDKRAVISGLYLILLTLVMIAIILGMYAVHQRNAQNALISPKLILDLRDEKELFEYQELEHLQQTVSVVCDEDIIEKETFRHEVRTRFLEGYPQNMKDFLQKDLNVGTTAQIEFDNYLYNNIYERDHLLILEDNMVIQRPQVSKKLLLKSKHPERINFPMELTYTFENQQEVRIPCANKLIEGVVL